MGKHFCKLRNVNYLLNFHGNYPVVVSYDLQLERLSICTNIFFFKYITMRGPLNVKSESRVPAQFLRYKIDKPATRQEMKSHEDKQYPVSLPLTV